MLIEPAMKGMDDKRKIVTIVPKNFFNLIHYSVVTLSIFASSKGQSLLSR